MYNLPYYKEEDRQVLMQFLHDHPFAFLTGSKIDGTQVATQVPILVEEQKEGLYLQGHVMRNSDHHRAFMENPRVLAVFTGPHSYVSATWYIDTHIASTWNYMSVHARGSLRFLPEDGLISLLKKLTLRFEESNTGSPVVYENLPDEFLNNMLPAIVGFEMKVDALENVFKLSQNRDERSYRNIISQLERKGGNGALIADAMKKRIRQLFPAGKEAGNE